MDGQDDQWGQNEPSLRSSSGYVPDSDHSCIIGQIDASDGCGLDVRLVRQQVRDAESRLLATYNGAVLAEYYSLDTYAVVLI
jgi:hypothetical protein